MKVCKKHGDLSEENIIIEKSKVNKNGIQIRCRLCKLEKDRRWKSNNREQHIAGSIRWKKENKEHVNEWNRNDRKLNPEKYKKYEKNYIQKHGMGKIRLREVLRVHGISKEKHDFMIELQKNLCAICKESETRSGRTKGTITPLCIDHCHKCREQEKDNIRGLLCHECNTGIGKFKDDIELMKKAIIYLDRHKCN